MFDKSDKKPRESESLRLMSFLNHNEALEGSVSAFCSSTKGIMSVFLDSYIANETIVYDDTLENVMC